MRFKSLVFAVVLSLVSFSSFADVVNLNKANAAALQYHLKGIGVKKAERIINYRSEHQGFKDISEIMEVRGIGQRIFFKIKGKLSLTEGVVSLSEPTSKSKKKKISVESKTDVVETKQDEKKQEPVREQDAKDKEI